MEIRTVPAGNGWRWITSGYELFKKSPLIWIVLTLVLFGIAIVIQFIPFVGRFVSPLLYPTFLAGLMMGCRDIQRGEELEIGHLFSGFQKPSPHLITIGGVSLVTQIVTLAISAVVVGLDINIAFGVGTIDSFSPEATIKLLLAGLIATAISLPIFMALWFAPLLVVFHDLPAFPAMQMSFSACLKNIGPFTIYGICYIAITLVAIIPLGLGLLIVIPLVFPTIYASYNDVFPNDPEINPVKS